MDVNEQGQVISVLDQHPDAVRQYGQPIQEKDLVRWTEQKEGPFNMDLRVHCPMHKFQLMPSCLCINCPWFGGMRQRIIHPGAGKTGKAEPLNFEDPLVATKAFMVICGYPQTRGLTYVPHVEV